MASGGNSAQRKRSENTRARRKVVVLTKKEKAAPPSQSEAMLVREGVAFLLFVLGVFLSLSLASTFRQLSGVESPLALASQRENLMGPVGSWVSAFLIHLLGWCSLVSVAWAFLLAHSVWTGSFPNKDKENKHTFFPTILASGVLAVAAATAVAVAFGDPAGGYLGAKVSAKLVPLMNKGGAFLVSAAGFVLALGMATGLHTSSLLKIGTRSGTGMRKGVQLTAKGVGVVGRANVTLGRALFASFGRGIRRSLTASELLFKTPESEGGPRVVQAPAQITLRSKDVPRIAVVPEKEVAVEEEEDEEEDEDEESESELKISRQRALPAPAGKEERGTQRTTLGGRLRRSFTRRRNEKETVVETETEIHDDTGFEMPALDLLVRPDPAGIAGPKDAELVANCRQLEKTLLDFRIGGKIIEVHPGPVITLYQFEPAPGIKVQRIVTLADDLALALKVASVRVYAPVPGKGTVGIEVPNQHREIVRLREVLDSEPWRQETSVLELALGKDTFGEPYVADLAKMPHLLIAGATGTGKSVCINSLLLSLLYRSSPRDLRLILIDPKMLELSVYENIPHLKAPVVTNPKRARGVLWWAVEEMERRYRAMKELGVRSLDSFNRVALGGSIDDIPAPPSFRSREVIELTEEHIVATATEEDRLDRGQVEEERPKNIPQAIASGHEYMPRIVIVVDELADLMLTVGREIEELLTRLAQKARAAGIHLILATQRPSVNVITGLIKANFPARISFKVASRIDARTVMDISGAEQLLGQGDMLFLPPGTSRMKRIHSAFVSDKEVHDVVHWLRSQGEPDYDPLIEEMIEKIEESEKSAELGGPEVEYDPLYDQAVNLVLEKGQASTSMIQRVFRIGYNRAARILETMEREGLIGPADGARPRQVLVPGGRSHA